MSPLARTLALLRRSGYAADVCERFIAPIRRKRDLFGFADVLAVRRGIPGVLAVQATTRRHVPDRLARAKGRPELGVWLASGNAFEVWGWQRDRQTGRWRVHRVAVAADELRDVVLTPGPCRRRPRQRELF